LNPPPESDIGIYEMSESKKSIGIPIVTILAIFLVVLIWLLNSICPADYAITPIRTPSTHTTLASCNAWRAAAAPCTVAVAITNPNAVCNAYCVANWWSCTGSVINSKKIVGNQCYPLPNGRFAYMCVATADCHCSL